MAFVYDTSIPVTSGVAGGGEAGQGLLGKKGEERSYLPVNSFMMLRGMTMRETRRSVTASDSRK